MKSYLILFISFFLINVSSNAHDKIVFKTKESFNQSCESDKFCSQFDMLNSDDKESIKSASKFIKDNSTIFKATAEGTVINLQVLTPTPEKAYYEKLFHLLNLQEIEILEGDSKGIYSVDEFLSLYNF